MTAADDAREQLLRSLLVERFAPPPIRPARVTTEPPHIANDREGARRLATAHHLRLVHDASKKPA